VTKETKREWVDSTEAIETIHNVNGVQQCTCLQDACTLASIPDHHPSGNLSVAHKRGHHRQIHLEQIQMNDKSVTKRIDAMPGALPFPYKRGQRHPQKAKMNSEVIAKRNDSMTTPPDPSPR
jgi:hypothetical protein